MTFKVINSYTSDELFKKDLDLITRTLNEKKIDDLSLEEMDRLIRLYERSAISCRRVLEERENISVPDDQKYNRKKAGGKEKFSKNLPVNVANITTENGTGMHIYLPYIFRRGTRDSFALANYVNAKILEFEDEIDFNCLQEKKFVYVIRVAKKYNRKVHCDNDNLETSNIINLVFNHINSSDNCLKMSFLSDFIKSDDESIYGTHMILLPYDEDDGILISPKRALNLALKNTKLSENNMKVQNKSKNIGLNAIFKGFFDTGKQTVRNQAMQKDKENELRSERRDSDDNEE